MPDINSKLSEQNRFFYMENDSTVDIENEIIENLTNEHQSNELIEQTEEVIENNSNIIEATIDESVFAIEENSKNNDNLLIAPDIQNFITETVKNYQESIVETNGPIEKPIETNDQLAENKLKLFQPKSDEVFKDYFKNIPNLKLDNLAENKPKCKIRYTFDFESFLEVFNERQNLVDPHIFSFVSFSTSQLVEMFYKKKKNGQFKENLKKSLSNIFYSLLEDKLVYLFNDPAYSFSKKCISALVQIIGVWNLYNNEQSDNELAENETSNKRVLNVNDKDNKKIRFE